MESYPEEPGFESIEHDPKATVQHFANGHQLIVQSVSSHRSRSPKSQSKKPASFNRDFKQAVFQKRGNDDGTSNLRVTFTSSNRAGTKCATARPITVAKQLAEREDKRTKPRNRPFLEPITLVNIKPKPKNGMNTDCSVLLCFWDCSLFIPTVTAV